MLQRNGFNGRRTAVLKTSEAICVYGVENQDGFNLCTPCYTSGTQVRTPMLEGNALSGLLAASKSPILKQLVRDSGNSLAKVLVPVQAYQEPTCNLYQSSSKPFIFQYKSSAAHIGIGYKYNPSKNRGMTAISIKSPWFDDFGEYASVYLPS